MALSRNRLFVPLAILCAGLSSCDSGGADALPPNVVLLVLDTVRADHVSCYGYARSTTPHVDALAESAVRYTECRATGPWTLPSHASMFTGRFAFQHRADSLLNDEGEWRELPLKLEYTTLAEVLRDMGYRTGALVANAAYLREDFQLDQGFDHYDVKTEAGTEKNKAAFAWLDQGQEPFFLFLNYMDAHRPYNTQPLADERATNFGCDDVVPSATLLDRMVNVVLRDGKPAPAALTRELTACYDLGIANADLAVGEVVAELRARGMWENTLLIVTSDHGEFLGEHNLVEHSKDIYEEVLHVPLLCKFPGQSQGSLDEGLVSLADLPRIVASALPRPLREEMNGHFPLPLERDFLIAEVSISRERDMRSSYSERFRRQRQVFYANGHKLILSTDGQHELYNLGDDPREVHNLYTSQGDLVLELTRRLEGFVRDHPPEYAAADPPTFDEEAMRILEQLGYVGGGPDEEQ